MVAAAGVAALVPSAATTAGAAVPATLAPGAPRVAHGMRSIATPAADHAVAATGGVLAYVSDSDYYGSNGTESLGTVDPEGKGYHALVTSVHAAIGLLAFSPTGARLAYFRGTSSSSRIEVMNLSTGAASSILKLRTTHAYVNGIAWSHDGRDLVVSTNEVPGTSTTHSYSALWLVPVAGGKSQRITPYDDAGSPSVAPDGDIVYVVSKTFTSTSLHASSVWMAGPHGGGRHRIYASSHFIDWPSVSPSGSTIAFSLLDSDTSSHIESMGIGGGTPHAITRLVKGRSDVQPSWSPDGTHLAFLSSRSGRHYDGTKADQLMDAYVMDATGKAVTAVVSFRGDEKAVAALEWGP